MKQVLHISGYSLKGRKPVKIRRYTNSKKANVLSCIGWEGLVAHRITAECTKSIDFNSFIMDLVVPNIPIGSRIVLDNASFHQAVELKAAVELLGRKLEFLPPYSPDLNPIEISYGYVKGQMNDYYLSTRFPDLIKSIAFVMDTISGKLTQSWYRRCLYI